jgi:hypothetical protein
MEPIAVHPEPEPGRFSSDGRRIASEKISVIEPGAAWLRGCVRLIGRQSVRWAEAMIQARGVEGLRVIQGLLSLNKRRRAAAIERACETEHGYREFRLRTVRVLMERQAASLRGRLGRAG